MAITVNKDKTYIFNMLVSVPASGWSEVAPFTQSVECVGMSPYANANVDVLLSADIELGIVQEAEWAKVSKVIGERNSITLMCYEEAPVVDLVVSVQGVKK